MEKDLIIDLVNIFIGVIFAFGVFSSKNKKYHPIIDMLTIINFGLLGFLGTDHGQVSSIVRPITCKALFITALCLFIYKNAEDLKRFDANYIVEEFGKEAEIMPSYYIKALLLLMPQEHRWIVISESIIDYEIEKENNGENCAKKWLLKQLFLIPIMYVYENVKAEFKMIWKSI